MLMLRRRFALALGTVGAAALAGASPALALQTTSILTKASNGATLGGNCVDQAGVQVGQNQPFTVALTAEATAASASALDPAVGTGLVCYVRDLNTGFVYGQISRGLPGVASAWAGTVSVPAGALISICMSVNATFFDGFGTTVSNC
jgi:hypothetical protein